MMRICSTYRRGQPTRLCYKMEVNHQGHHHANYVMINHDLM